MSRVCRSCSMTFCYPDETCPACALERTDGLRGRIVAADTKGERLLVTIQLDKIEPVGVGARVQVVNEGLRADVEALVTACQVYLAGSTAKPKADQRIDILKAVARVDDHIR